jgi:hypothetical protein
MQGLPFLRKQPCFFLGMHAERMRRYKRQNHISGQLFVAMTFAESLTGRQKQAEKSDAFS